MRNLNKKFKRKLKPKGEPLDSIPKSFTKSNVLPLSVIKKGLEFQRYMDTWYNYGGSCLYRSNSNAMFTSRNSHKKTNKR